MRANIRWLVPVILFGTLWLPGCGDTSSTAMTSTPTGTETAATTEMATPTGETTTAASSSEGKEYDFELQYQNDNGVVHDGALPTREHMSNVAVITFAELELRASQPQVNEVDVTCNGHQDGCQNGVLMFRDGAVSLLQNGKVTQLP